MSKQLNLKQAPKLDLWLCGAVLTLLTIGLVMVYSASVFEGNRAYGDPQHFIRKQLIFAGLGVMLVTVLLRVPTSFFQKNAIAFALLALLLCVLVLIPGIGKVVNNSRRWIDFGFGRFQVSEFAKLALIFFMAAACARRNNRGLTNTKSLVVPFVLALIPVAFIYLEPDLGTPLVICAILMVILLVAGLKWRVFFGLVLFFAPIGYHSIFSTGRAKRIFAFLDPWANQSESAFQLTNTIIAIGSGGPVGLGLGKSKQSFFLPEAHTDFIFAILAETLGFIGVVFFVTTCVVLVFRCVRIAMRAPNLFTVYLATGITAMLAIPMVFNMAVATGLLPTKGLALPFTSYGGSHLLISMVGVGILLRIHLESVSGRDLAEAEA